MSTIAGMATDRLSQFAAAGLRAQAAVDAALAAAPADVSAWLTKAEAAAAIGLSTKAVERLVQAGRIQQARRPSAKGGAALAVYFPDDVAREAAERRTGPLPAFLVPTAAGTGPAAPPAAQAGALARQEATPAPALEDLLRRLFDAAGVVSQMSQTSPALFVTVAEAAAIAGLPAADIRRAVDAGELAVRRTGRGGWRIRRRDLEAL